MVAEWSKILMQIQVAVSPLQTQVQSLPRTCINVTEGSRGLSRGGHVMDGSLPKAANELTL